MYVCYHTFMITCLKKLYQGEINLTFIIKMIDYTLMQFIIKNIIHFTSFADLAAKKKRNQTVNKPLLL
jgi:hypothetical protein